MQLAASSGWPDLMRKEKLEIFKRMDFSKDQGEYQACLDALLVDAPPAIPSYVTKSVIPDLDFISK
jgi:hypothetical protein